MFKQVLRVRAHPDFLGLSCKHPWVLAWDFTVVHLKKKVELL